MEACWCAHIRCHGVVRSGMDWDRRLGRTKEEEDSEQAPSLAAHVAPAPPLLCRDGRDLFLTKGVSMW